MTGAEVEGIRRSSRTKNKRSPGTDADVEDNSLKVHRKRPRWQPKVGRLADLLKMPMDILLEIFGHLRPLDLLHLSRTTKEFRHVLMHRSSISVWRAARGNVPGFPDCPTEMSEPQWANLAFSPHCNICLTPGIRNVDWRLRIRICSHCAKEQIEEWYPLMLDDDEFMVSLQFLVPTRPGKRGSEAYLREEYRRVGAQYIAINDPDERSAFVEARLKLLKEIKSHAILCEDWAAAQALDRSQELQQLRDSRKQAIIDRLTSLGWGEEIDKIPYYDALSHHKLVKNPQLLTERIWKNIRRPMIEYMEQMKAKRLEREKAALILVRKSVAVNVLRTYKSSNLPYTTVMPEPFDFCSFAPIKNVLEQPTEVVIDESSFADIVPMLPNMFGEWRDSLEAKLIKRIQDQNIRRKQRIELGWEEEEEDIPADEPDEVVAAKMKLATTVFKCRGCVHISRTFYGSDSDSDSDSDFFSFLDFLTERLLNKPLWYPKVLGHRCMTKSFGFALSDDPSVKLDFLRAHRKKWQCQDLEVDRATSKIVENIVKTCGLDTAVATADDMDALDPRLACLSCSGRTSEPGQTLVFGWRSAVIHHMEAHSGSDCHWSMLLPDQADVARQFEDVFFEEMAGAGTEPLPSDRVVWSCLHCQDLPTEQPPMALRDLEAHLEQAHDTFQPQLNQDYTKDFAALQIYDTGVRFQMSIINLLE